MLVEFLQYSDYYLYGEILGLIRINYVVIMYLTPYISLQINLRFQFPNTASVC